MFSLLTSGVRHPVHPVPSIQRLYLLSGILCLSLGGTGVKFGTSACAGYGRSVSVSGHGGVCARVGNKAGGLVRMLQILRADAEERDSDQ